MKAVILHQKHAAEYRYNLCPWIQRLFNSHVCACAFNSNIGLLYYKELEEDGTWYTSYHVPYVIANASFLPVNKSSDFV